MRDTDRRDELKSFLRSRRERLVPEKFGIVDSRRRRRPGLRREEVAQLVQVSTTWYTWFESGRNIKVSRRFLGDVATLLELNQVEREHLFELVFQHPQDDDAGTPLPANFVQQGVLDRLHPTPAYITNERLDVVAANAAARLVFDYRTDETRRDRNIVWRLFMDPGRAGFHEHWERTARDILANFRQRYARHLHDPAFAELQRELMSASDVYRRWWGEQDVIGTQSRASTCVIHHGSLGTLSGRFAYFDVVGHAGYTLAVYLLDQQLDLSTVQ
jgi:hypothetical protein